MLFTRKGDGGTSGLLGTQKRFPKNSPVYDALGALDELNSILGVCRARSLGEKRGDFDISTQISKIQECLFIAQAELAGAQKSITRIHVDEIEQTTGMIEDLIENPHAFVVPGATELSGLLDYARAVSRRAERTVIEAHAVRKVSSPTRAYLNRLSSLLFALARYAAAEAGMQESSPSY